MFRKLESFLTFNQKFVICIRDSLLLIFVCVFKLPMNSESLESLKESYVTAFSCNAIAVKL